jgi:hypothetical protein
MRYFILIEISYFIRGDNCRGKSHFLKFFRIGSVTPISYFILLKCLMKNICCLNFHLKLPFPLSKNRQFVFPPITYCFRIKILKSIWSSNFQSSFRIIYWFIFWQYTPKQILIKVLTAMITMPPYRNILNHLCDMQLMFE